MLEKSKFEVVKECYCLSVLSSTASVTQCVNFLGDDVSNLKFGSFGKASSGPVALCSQHEPHQKGVLVENGVGEVLNLSLNSGRGCGWGMGSCSAPGYGSSGPARGGPARMSTFLGGQGACCGFQRQHGEGGWPAQRPHCRRKALSSHSAWLLPASPLSS